MARSWRRGVTENCWHATAFIRNCTGLASGRPKRRSPWLSTLDRPVKHSQNVLSDKITSGGGVLKFKPNFSAHLLHGMIVRHDDGADAVEFFIAPNLHQTLEQLGSQSALLA